MPLPPYAETDDRPPIGEATINVDCAAVVGELPAIWAGIGFDEINWTYTATGSHLLHTIRGFAQRPYYVRSHYLFTSGNGRSLPHWGSGNVYHEDAGGVPFWDFTIADQVYDAIVGAGHRPLVELGFTPRALVSDDDMRAFPFEPSPTQYGVYEAGAWAYPPSDYGKWAALVAELARHCRDRYGAAEVDGWLWELWNEPDIFYWRGSPEQFHELYAVTSRALREVLPAARIGGPATTGEASGPQFLRGFLAYCEAESLPLDFVSFHTKGALFSPARTYGPLGSEPPARQSPSALKMLREVRDSLQVMAEFPAFARLRAVIDECDASVPAHLGCYDSANFGYRNTEYFPVFQLKLMKKLLDLGAACRADVAMAMTWSFYFEGERHFEGTRSLLTTDRIEKPVLNGYRLLEKMHPRRLAATSTAAWALAELDADARSGMAEEVDALATTDGSGHYTVAIWRHRDDQFVNAPACRVAVRLTGLPREASRATVVEWRIDADHSNSYTRWREAGSPSAPTPEDLAAIKSRQGLEMLEPERDVDVAAGSLDLELWLPLPSVSLLEICLAETSGSP